MGAFVFSIKDLTFLKGFSEINKAHSENCFGNESLCTTDLVHTDTPACTECSGVNSRIGLLEWECKSTFTSTELGEYFSRGTTLYPNLKVRCQEGTVTNGVGCVSCQNSSCSTCILNSNICLGCDLDEGKGLNMFSYCVSGSCASGYYY